MYMNTFSEQAARLHCAFENLGKDVKLRIDSFKDDVALKCRCLQSAVSGIKRQIEIHGAAATESIERNQALLFASLSTMATQSQQHRSNPIFDVAAHPEEIKKRLSGVPVYVVVNNKNEFVLVDGEGEKSRQLGLFFFDKDDAEGLISTIKEQNPKLGKSVKVLATSMDAVYEFSITPRTSNGTQGVVFRYMPDANQVANALELYRFAGLPNTSFSGVPLFQAEGLTVRGETARYTPLFFSKDDLDIALRDAFLARDDKAQADARAKSERAKEELTSAQVELQGASGDRAKKAAQKKVEAATKRLETYEKRLADATAKKAPPRVDVGSLEEVLAKMEADDKGEWGDVLFVPAGALAEQNDSGK